MKKLIAFSGGCHSGKTTLMNEVADVLKRAGVEVIVFKENAHKFLKKGGIDELRANPTEYLAFQQLVIQERINFEKNVLKGLVGGKDAVILLDRPITDSLAYMFMYINVDSLNSVELKTYAKLVSDIEEHVTDYANYVNVESHIFALAPLKQSCSEEEMTYRPKGINKVKAAEASVTKTLLYTYPQDDVYINDLSAYDKLEDRVNKVMKWTGMLSD